MMYEGSGNNRFHTFVYACACLSILAWQGQKTSKLGESQASWLPKVPPGSRMHPFVLGDERRPTKLRLAHA